MSNKNEVAKVENTELDVFAGLGDLSEFKAEGAITGLEAMDTTDIKMPKVRLLQSNSIEVTKGGFKAGQFYNTVTKEATDVLNCTLLVLGKSRVMWPEKFKRGDEPTCRSFDNVRSFDGCKSCEKCEHSNWEKAKADGKNKPDCNMSYAWLGVDQASGTPFRTTMGGMSVGPTKDFLSQIALKRLPAFVYNVEMSSEQQENENGVFFVVKYKVTGVITKDQFQPLDDMAKSLEAMFKSAIEKDTLDVQDGVDAEAAPTGESGGLF